VFADGSLYEGEVKSGTANGYGRHIRNNGNYYIG
jgi:hypothetical protein